MKNVILFLLVFVLSSTMNVHAEDSTWLHLGMLSYHLSSKNYNEHHRLIAIEHNEWSVGYYNNSYEKDSFFVFKSFTINKYDKYLPDRATFKLKTGLISGYSDVFEGVMPAVVPALSFDYEPVSFDINILFNVYSIEFKIKLR